MAWIKLPYVITAEPTVTLRSAKEFSRTKMPMMGMMMSAVRESAMALKAPPTMTPTAISITLPRAINCLNSATNPLFFSAIKSAFFLM